MGDGSPPERFCVLPPPPRFRGIVPPSLPFGRREGRAGSETQRRAARGAGAFVHQGGGAITQSNSTRIPGPPVGQGGMAPREVPPLPLPRGAPGPRCTLRQALQWYLDLTYPPKRSVLKAFSRPGHPPLSSPSCPIGTPPSLTATPRPHPTPPIKRKGSGQRGLTAPKHQPRRMGGGRMRHLRAGIPCGRSITGFLSGRGRGGVGGRRTPQQPGPTAP